ncbi:MAG: aldehyde ferredoxin oxidoreductase family protein [Chloroflexi bacterium]|uniref:Aldehyde ferredoxin oxidoreductase family protein n=1 Tax=Candidatus Chlorohelix allophototropha TaxID=3003348 RepID=A0A8T7M2K7_9CHLR|nr:aldehyde ferredoxin oxidoreductase family protein [Chloroflexota bacterium]WJW67228.1 aldehyde ferredoxin oxidoreductase family protein [Chloroflexota bacterium L227-S17]
MSYANKVLRVNLTTRKVISLPLPEQLKREYLGGRGIAVKMLYELLPRNTEPLSPENILIFATGPLNGTMAPAAASVTACARSPLTGLLGIDTVSGFWASELKFAGYDMIIVEGAADEPVYIEIDDDRCDIKPADWLKGRGTYDTLDLLHQRLGDDYKIAVIGPAGENKVPYASILCDYIDPLARTGLGAVMGSKNLKAIAVHGTKDITLYNTDRFLQKMRDIHNKVKNDRLFGAMSRYGTTELLNVSHSNGALLIRNGQDGVFNRIIGVSRNTMDNLSRSQDRRLAERPCSACIMPCKAIIESSRGKRPRPNYVTISNLGPRLGISNGNTIIEAGFLCDNLGLDPISMAGSIAFLMECYQRRLYDEDVLDWGNDETVLELIRLTALRQGTGELLSKGVRQMSRIIDGSRDFAMEVKGLEINAVDGRAAKGHALAMAISNRGGDTAYHMPQFELLDKTEAEAENEFIFSSAAIPSAWQGKANMVIWHEYFGAVLDSSAICKHYSFTTYALKPADVADLLTFAIGTRFTEMDIMLIGERISTVERLFNLRNGMNPRLDDTLPNRFLRERLTEGKASGQYIELNKMLEEYYMLRGFTADGMPRIENLQTLGIVSEKTRARR